jgi:acyl-[acyl-carrier-protein] desaturase
MIQPVRTITKEINEQRPPFLPSLLSRQEKDRLIQRGLIGLYRWYTSRSQATRNWNPDKDFNWRDLRTDHSPGLNLIIEGFFAIEQFVPDYASSIIRATRESYGRSHFHIRWGAEEEKHSDLWLNTTLFLRFRTPAWLEDYQHQLRSQEWKLPWDDATHMLFYQVLQERATQVNYLNTALIAAGKSDKPEFANDKDPVLAHIAHTIAVDEAAHYNFFLEVSLLYLYYYPAQTLDCLVEVMEHFAMPALDLIPNSQNFQDAIYRAGIYGPRVYASDVLQIALDNLSIRGRRALVNGLRHYRQVPDPDGNMRDTAIFEAIDYPAVESAVKRLFGRIEAYEQETGRATIDPTCFVPSGLV